MITLLIIAASYLAIGLLWYIIDLFRGEIGDGPDDFLAPVAWAIYAFGWPWLIHVIIAN